MKIIECNKKITEYFQTCSKCGTKFSYQKNETIASTVPDFSLMAVGINVKRTFYRVCCPFCGEKEVAYELEIENEFGEEKIIEAREQNLIEKLQRRIK